MQSHELTHAMYVSTNQFIEQKDWSDTYIDMRELHVEKV